VVGEGVRRWQRDVERDLGRQLSAEEVALAEGVAAAVERAFARPLPPPLDYRRWRERQDAESVGKLQVFSRWLKKDAKE
jgi:hypothetical protein